MKQVNFVFLNAPTLGEIVIHHHMLKPMKIIDRVSHDPKMKIGRDGLPRKVSSLKNIAGDFTENILSVTLLILTENTEFAGLTTENCL